MYLLSWGESGWAVVLPSTRSQPCSSVKASPQKKRERPQGNGELRLSPSETLRVKTALGETTNYSALIISSGGEASLRGGNKLIHQTSFLEAVQAPKH